MIAYTDVRLELPAIPEMNLPREFSQSQINALIQFSRRREPSSRILQVLDRIRALRGSSITWGLNLAVSDLVSRAASLTKSYPALIAPLTLFKIHRGFWVPKVMIQAIEDFEIESGELLAYHAACHSAGIEFMCIARPLDAYLHSNDFKRAFNGAFFCDHLKNSTVFCPTLRQAGLYTWPG